MAKRLLSISILVLLCSSVSFAQSGSISGTITDAETGETIPGANVYIKSIQRGASSDAQGNYTINNIASDTYKINASFVGYKSAIKNIQVGAGETTVNFKLESDLIGLEDVVVTAQQIEKNKRELGYSVSAVSGGEVKKAEETNFVNALAGKVPGVSVTNQSGNIGGSSRITIRGLSSLTGNNQPLFVIDGNPISNANIVGNTSQERLNGAIDVGNRGSDINPNDIKNVSVLKGAAAAALYGQRARNGVILITTKKGTSQEGASVDINSTVTSSSPLKLPEFQNEYGPGDFGKYDKTLLNGWGPKITGQQVENFQGDKVNLQAYPDNVRNFYSNAVSATNSLSISGGDKESDYRLGYTRQDQSGIIPNSSLDKNTITFNTGRRFDYFSTRISGSYINTSLQGKAVQGGNDPNVLTPLINTLPRTTSITSLSDYVNEDGTQNAIDNFTNNPYWIVNKNIYNSNIDRVFGSGNITFKPVDNFSVKLRMGTDFYTEQRRNINAKGTIGQADGSFSLDVIKNVQVDGDLIFNYHTDINEDFNLKALAGANINSRSVKIQTNEAKTLSVPGLYNFANATSNTPSNHFEKQHLMGFYGDVTLGFRDYLFLEVTGRNDISSTLPKDNRSYFYPSANLSYVFTDGLDIDSDILSYGKVRANYAIVGNDAGPYQLNFSYEPVADIFGQYGTDNSFPYGGQVGFDATGTIPPSNLKPEKTYSYELGTELQFFGGRIGFDFTYYNIIVKDEIISIPIPETTGFAFNRRNVGELSNKGIEIALNATPVRERNFNWNMNVNFAKNTNKVEKLAPGVDEILIQSAYNNLQVKAEPGKSLGLYGTGFARDPKTGKVLINPSSGLRVSGRVKRLGGIDPDFKLGFSNTFNIHNVGISFLIDWNQGGSIYSETVRSLRSGGVSNVTLANRGRTFIDDGVIAIRDGSGKIVDSRPNNVPVQSMEDYWQKYYDDSIQEGSIFPATYVKLREAKISYNFSPSTLSRTPFSNISVSLVGRNLFLLYSEIPDIDPETGLFGSASNGQGIEYNNLPTVRSFGASISLSL